LGGGFLKQIASLRQGFAISR